MKIKRAAALFLLAAVLVSGCGSDGGINKRWIKKNVDFSIENKSVEFEVSTAELVDAGYGGALYEVLWKGDGKILAHYFAGSNSAMKIEESGGKCRALEIVGNSAIEREVSGGAMEIGLVASDFAKVEEILSINWRKAAIISVQDIESTGETAVVVSEDEPNRRTVLFLDGDRLSRVESVYVGEGDSPSPMYFLVIKQEALESERPLEEISDSFDEASWESCTPQEMNSILKGFVYGGMAVAYSTNRPEPSEE